MKPEISVCCPRSQTREKSLEAHADKPSGGNVMRAFVMLHKFCALKIFERLLKSPYRSGKVAESAEMNRLSIFMIPNPFRQNRLTVFYGDGNVIVYILAEVARGHLLCFG